MSRLIIHRQCLIGDSWADSSSRKSIEVRNPANDELITQVPNCTESEIREAIHNAQNSFSLWATRPAHERSQILMRLKSLIDSEIGELARILTLEQGKPLAEAQREIAYGAGFIEWFAQEAPRIYGETIPSNSISRRIIVLRQPIGVCAAITPWNFPNAMVTRTLAPALAAGCPLILKPAPETPLSALALAKLAQEAGVPAGVFQVVTTEAELFARTIMENPIVRKLSFTGSTDVGKILIRQSADTVKRLTLELGGNAPLVVFEDADIAKAVTDCCYAKYRNAGQTCISINRILVQAKIAKEFSENFVSASRCLKVGNGLDAGTTVGPLISDEAVSKVSALLEDAQAKGANILCGGMTSLRKRFLEPTVLDGLNSSMQIWREEIFGPIAAIRTFETEQEAIQLANDSAHGLVCYCYTKDLARAVRVSEALEFGMVGLNDTMISSPQAPFGGIKESGYGREGGHQGIDEYLNLKYISIGL